MNILSDSDLLVIKINNGQPDGYPLTYSNFRLINPQTSFPDLPDNSFLVDYGFYRFRYINKPSPVKFEHTKEGPIVFNDELDTWTNSWVQVPFTTEEMDSVREQTLTGIRSIRNQKLYECDWTQLPVNPLTTEQKILWEEYRQQLRDYMALVTDPFNPPKFPTPPAS